ncbi:MAG: hypothetical protein ACM3NF_03965 [Gemmatimonadota bacterium]
MDTRTVLAAAFAIGLLGAGPAFPDEGPEAQRESAAGGVTIGEIRIIRQNIFDTEDPREDNWLYRLANRLHIRTRPSVIAHQLLFRPGDPYDPRLLAESERILRSNAYFYDARIRPGEVRDGRVDVEVRTRDVWTLQPGISFERKGGSNTTGITFKETNFLGLGSALSFAARSTPDRRTESVSFEDDHLFHTWLATSVTLSNNSDGRTRRFSLEHPFYALDVRWAAGGLYSEDERIDTLVGAVSTASRFRTTARSARLSGGWSRGLVDGWTLRLLIGGTRDESRFSAPPGEPVAAPVPADRILVYPFAGFELVQDNFETARNRDQIERTEDFYLGLRLRATVGYAFPSIGSDRCAVPFSASFGKGGRSGERWTVITEAAGDGRTEDGKVRDTTLSAGARVYLELSARWLAFASLAGGRQISPDADHQLDLGGDSGLRGYPRRYQAGDRKFLVTVEQRYFSTWYPFRLFRVGAAVFFDAGRAWGGDVAGLPAPGILRDAGFGLRIGNARSGLGNVIHVDVAFPFDGDPSIERVQFLVETKSSF